ncbi:uncharacterized protein BDCG_17320 [Blastomyces dermatitidis ER-3]|uniref:Uncharacterized protein n=1 Tax=Ajellomyces dermatitidis (strain ER-3 / ATCC MYA-2586) TaxID=559297 RepID=A0ABX2VXW0_AJEDR|nr:uncharacterized protein BDCG_17320 [Blastomyces dermatitidis ER-3]OAT01972.1 hypothetical protein BDCG_17320 [Blastomyces dermatitidis ER-3]
MKRVRNRLNTDELISRRDDTLLLDTVTTATAAKKAGEEEDVIIRAVLSRLIDTAASAFNLTFLMVTEAAATSQRHLFTRKHQNKLSTVLQE